MATTYIRRMKEKKKRQTHRTIKIVDSSSVNRWTLSFTGLSVPIFFRLFFHRLSISFAASILTQIQKKNPFVILYFPSPVEPNKRKTKKRYSCVFFLLSLFILVDCILSTGMAEKKQTLFIGSCSSTFSSVIKQKHHIVCTRYTVYFDKICIWENEWKKKHNFKIKKKRRAARDDSKKVKNEYTG